MSHFKNKIPVWIITLLFCLSQTLLGDGVPLQFNPNDQPTIEVSGTNTNSDSEDLPNPNAQDNLLSPAEAESELGSGSSHLTIVINEVLLTLNNNSMVLSPSDTLEDQPTIFFNNLTAIKFRLENAAGVTANMLVVEGKNSGIQTYSSFQIVGNEVRWTFSSMLGEDQYMVTFLPASYQLKFNILPADLNRDGVADGADYVVWRKNVGRLPDPFSYVLPGDVNDDNVVNDLDYTLWRAKFGVGFRTPYNFKPAAMIEINNNDPQTTTRDVTIFLTALDDLTSADQLQMAFSTDDGNTYSDYEPFQTTKAIALPGSDGMKTVRARIRDQAGNVYETQDEILFQEFVPLPIPNYDFLIGTGIDLTGIENDYGRNVTWVGDHFVVGVPVLDPNPNGYQGLFDIYNGDPNNPLFPEYITSLATTQPADFGTTVASTILGNRLLVGSPGDDWGGSSINEGVVDVFDLDPSSPTFGDYLETLFGPLTSDPGARYGEALVVNGTRIFVGAPYATVSSPPQDAGAVYQHEGNTASPSFGNRIRTYINPNPTLYRNFGRSIASVGQYVIIGAPDTDGAGPQQAAVFVYDSDPLSPTFGQLVRTITNPVAQNNSLFANKLSTFGNYVLVGAGLDSTAGTNGGAVYMYDLNPGSPTFGNRVGTFLNPTPRNIPTGEGFGNGLIAELDGYLMIGAERDNATEGYDTGIVYIFDANPLSPTTFQQVVSTITAPFPEPSATGNLFGASGSLRNGRLIIGAPGDLNGFVYLYERVSPSGSGASITSSLGESQVAVSLNEASPLGPNDRAPLFWQVTTLNHLTDQKKAETDSHLEFKPRKSHRFNQRHSSHLRRK